MPSVNSARKCRPGAHCTSARNIIAGHPSGPCWHLGATQQFSPAQKVCNDPLPCMYCSPPLCARPYVQNSLAQVSLLFVSLWYCQEHSPSPIPSPHGNHQAAGASSGGNGLGAQLPCLVVIVLGQQCPPLPNSHTVWVLMAHIHGPYVHYYAMLACVKRPYPFVPYSQSLCLSFSPSRKGKPQPPYGNHQVSGAEPGSG